MDYDSLYDAVSRIKAKTHLFSFSSDFLFLPEEMEHIYNMMKRDKKECTYKEIQSDYGHDAFLVELPLFEEYIRDILE